MNPSIRVLIVDDEAPARDKLRRWLAEAPDIELIGECANGLAAAAAIQRLTPDAVFLDIQMPGLSGLEVASQLEPQAAPLIIFVTAFDEHAIKAFDLAALDYLLKPYDKDRLRKSLDRLRARRDDAVFEADDRVADRDRVRARELTGAPHDLDLALLGQRLEPAGQTPDDAVLPRPQLVDVDRRLPERDPRLAHLGRLGHHPCHDCLSS